VDQDFDVHDNNNGLENENAVEEQTTVLWLHALIASTTHGSESVSGLSVHGLERYHCEQCALN